MLGRQGLTRDPVGTQRARLAVEAAATARRRTMVDLTAAGPCSDGGAVPAGSGTFKKPCAGGAVAMFTSEVAMPTTADFLHMDMRATCVNGGGFTQHCTPGQQIFASPGHSFFQNGQAPVHTGAIQMAWTGLA